LTKLHQTFLFWAYFKYLTLPTNIGKQCCKYKMRASMISLINVQDAQNTA
jgi:hypothetical protein